VLGKKEQPSIVRTKEKKSFFQLVFLFEVAWLLLCAFALINIDETTAHATATASKKGSHMQ
jgi:hypothetical protein